MGEVKMQKTAAALKALSGRYGVTINELASHLELSRRSAYRMLESLEGLGVRVETTMDDDGVFRKKIDEAERKRWESGIPPLELTVEEIIGLYLLKGGETVFKGTEVEGAIHAAFEKIEALLPADRARRKGVSLAPLRSLFLSSSRFTKDYSGKDELIALLAEAIIRRCRCTLRYHAFRDDTEKTYGADPLHFFERDGGLYLYVRKAKEGHIRTLAVERIEEVKPTEESFDYPADFDPEAFMEQAFNLVHDDPVDARIRFAADQAKYIRERRWAKTQKVTEKRDGSVVLDIETSGLQEVKRWVLSFGASATVISPRKLRDEVETELAKGLDRYRKGPRG
jgi:predicted DNA-binding transcriptional regulator YafY